MQKVSFPCGQFTLAGHLYLPENFNPAQKYPALVVTHPFGGVKEQASGNYAKKMAEQGYITLAYDASCQGESTGTPRDTENPYQRMDDIRSAIDFLVTHQFVDDNRIGLLGVCAGGGYALGVAPTELRAKAVAVVSLWDMGVTARDGWPAPEYDKKAVLEMIAKQRTVEARGGSVQRDFAFQAEKPAGLPKILDESYDYYRTPRAAHPNSRGIFVFTDFARLMEFYYEAHIDEIAPRPVMFIVGTEAQTIFMSKKGFDKAQEPKKWVEIDGATHHQLYDTEPYLGQAVAKLSEFFGENL